MKVISCKGESLEEVKWTYNNTLFIKHMCNMKKNNQQKDEHNFFYSR